MQQTQILPSRFQLNQKKLLEYCGVGFAAATASALFFPMPPVATLLDNVKVSASVGMAVAALYIELKEKGWPMVTSSLKRRGVFASYAPSIAYPRAAASAPRAAVKPTARVQAKPQVQAKSNIRQEAELVVAFMRERGIRLNVDYHVSPGNYVFRLELASMQKFKDVDKLADDLERAIYRHRLANNLIRRGDQRAFVRCRFTMQPDVLEVNRPERKTLPYDDVRNELKPFAAMAGMTYPTREGSPLVWDFTKSAMPHVLVCGTTGSGKSGQLMTLAYSMCEATSPEHLVMYVVDGGKDALQSLSSLPHTVSVETDYQGAATTLQTVRRIIEARREAQDKGEDRRVLLVVDEFANLSDAILYELGKTAQTEFIRDFTFATSEGRKWGVHCAVGTQKALAEVTGSLSKANMALRLVGMVTDKNDAVTSTGRAGSGAERLAGEGDFVYVLGGFVTRYQVPWIEYPLKLANEISKKWQGKKRMEIVSPAVDEPESPTQSKEQKKPTTAKRAPISPEAELLLPGISTMWDNGNGKFYHGQLTIARGILGYPPGDFYKMKAEKFALEAWNAHEIQ